MFNIVICVYNKLEVTEKCIQSIRQYTPKDKYMIFFVNDGSEDIVRQWIKNQIIIYDDIIYIENKKNLGYVLSAIRGVEESIKSIDNPFIFVLNNDVFITDYWIDDAIKLFENKKVAIIGACGHKEVGGKKITFISGSRLIVRTKIVRELGFYDSNFNIGYWEDVDYSYRVQKAGYLIKKFSISII